MPDESERPSGATLDHHVLWAIHHLAPEGPVYTATIQFYVALKVGRVGIDDNDHQFHASITRSLKRLEKSGVIQTGRADGWEITPIPES